MSQLKRLLIEICALAVLCGPARAVPVGQPAPDFTLKDLEGNPVQLSGLIGQKVVALNFWASWGQGCGEEMEALRQLQTELGPKNLLVLGINQREEAGPIRAFAKAHQGEYALLPDDGAVSKLYEVNGVPDTYLIDWRGVVRRRLQGWGPVFEKELRKTVERLLNEQRPAPKEEPPPAKEEAPAAPSKGEPDKIPPELRAYAHLQLAAAYINIGDAFTRSGLEDDGNYDRAIKELTAGLAIDPKNVDLTAWLGVACERKGDRPRAIEYYRATLRLDPKHTYAQQALNRLGAPGPTEPETR